MPLLLPRSYTANTCKPGPESQRLCAHRNSTSLYAGPAHSGLYADRTARVKDARSEAAKDVEAYKRKKDQEFQAYEKEVSLYLSLFASFPAKG